MCDVAVEEGDRFCRFCGIALPADDHSMRVVAPSATANGSNEAKVNEVTAQQNQNPPELNLPKCAKGVCLYVLPWVLHALLYLVGTVAFVHLEDLSTSNAFYLAFCCLSTIGYGNIAPTNDPSRVFTIIYLLLGTPIAIVGLRNLTEFMLNQASIGRRKLGFKKKKGKSFKVKLRNFFISPENLIGMSVTCLVLIWLLISLAISYAEEWTYFQAFYFIAITMTTVGFGDIVTTKLSGLILTVVAGYLSIGLLSYLISFPSHVQHRVRRKSEAALQLAGLHVHPLHIDSDSE